MAYPKDRKRKLVLPDVAVLNADYVVLGTYTAVAKKYGCDSTWISEVLRKNGYEGPRGGQPFSVDVRLPVPEAVREKYLELGSFDALLKHYDVSKVGMNRYFRRHGIRKAWTKKVGVRTYCHCSVCGKQLSYKIRGENKKCRECWRKCDRGRNHHAFGKPAPWFTGPNNPNWKGGVSIGRRKNRRMDGKYDEWRKAVYRRDGWTCCMCGKHCQRKEIVAHHIYPWEDFTDLRHDVDNGITLCRECHGLTCKREMEFALLFRLYRGAA